MSNDVRALENELNQMILQGKAMDAFEKFYAEDVAMQENRDAPRKGKAAARDYEMMFFGNIEQFHGASLGAVAVDGDRSFSEWTFDVTFKDGSRMTNDQVAVRTWKGGQVVFERFYYQPNIVKS